MRKFVLATFVLLALATFGMALTDRNQDDKVAKTGEVVSVDTTGNVIVIKDAAGTESRILVSPGTKITREGKTAALADVKAGDKITTECDESADGCKAKSIQVTVPKPSK